MSVTAVPLQPVKSGYKVWLWLGILVAVAAAFGLAWAGTREQVAARGTNDQFLAWNKARLGVHTTASGLEYEQIKAGEGPAAQDGDGATVTIEGRLRDGTIFQPRTPAHIPVGQGMIAGFTEALKTMNKGSTYRFWLSPKLAYGDAPADSPLKDKVLIFDVHMDDLMNAAQMRQLQMQQLMQQQMQQQQQGGAGAPESGPGPGGEAPKQ
ncbi:MAG: FKBP-type peptidyl-prolyl cis-trans isomerase [Sphingomonas sp.]